ncbi:hypothetical protein [Methanocaldococcus fervens]|nr:hypothetical protein [Methanocaldococcus fervens]ACV25373.1 hypothetical protein Mefer_1570 [Methanocaldococcus fervens AG86]
MDILYILVALGLGVMGILGYFATVAGVIQFGEYILKFKKLLARSVAIKRVIWWAINKEIHIEFKSNKKYLEKINPTQKDLTNIRKIVVDIFTKEFGGINKDSGRMGVNYILIIPKEFNIPVEISILPNIELDLSLDYEDLKKYSKLMQDQYIKEYGDILPSDLGRECHIGTAISINLFGTLVFTYRKTKNYEKLLNVIDKIYSKIEEYYGLHKPFHEEYRLKLKVSENVIQSEIHPIKIRESDFSVTIKDTKVVIWSKTINYLRDAIKNYLLKIPIL